MRRLRSHLLSAGRQADGLSVLAFFLTAGFSFWGTTILNIWFSIAGVLLYCLVKRQKPGAMANAMLFSTGIGPLITDMLFRYPGADWHGFTLAGVLIALAVGVFIGFLLPAGLPHSPKMHKGYDLYSAAVPIGLTAFFLRSLLYKVFGGVLPESVNVGTDASFPLISYGFCILVFGIAILAALGMGADFRRYGALLKDSGYNVDFAQKYGTETALLNFGVYGLFIVLYYTLIGASWNAATLGCVFCMVCCCFKGSHPGNVLPIMIGYVLSSFGAKAVCSLTGAEFSMGHQCPGHRHWPLLCQWTLAADGRLWLAGRDCGRYHPLHLRHLRPAAPWGLLPLQRRIHRGLYLLPLHSGAGALLPHQRGAESVQGEGVRKKRPDVGTASPRRDFFAGGGHKPLLPGYF